MQQRWCFYLPTFLSFQDWIYRQICVSSTPLHPLLPPLIEAYIQSVIMPSMKTDRSNEPITEKEIMSVFSHSVFSPHNAMETEEGCSLTSQLLMLYYVLLYQDSVLSSMKSISKWTRRNSLNSYSVMLCTACQKLRQKNKSEFVHTKDTSRDNFFNVPSQWETMLQSNIVSYWLDTFTKWSLPHITHLWGFGRKLTCVIMASPCM